MMNHVLIVGNFHDGFTFVGPFSNAETAMDFGNEQVGEDNKEWMIDDLLTQDEALSNIRHTGTVSGL